MLCVHHADEVFDVDSTNKQVFDCVGRDIVRSVVSGYHGAIFAYGQTASGKTYTMQGDRTNPGIFGQAVEEIFKCIRESNNRQFLIRVSYVEVYKEKVYDLLASDEGEKSTKEPRRYLNPKSQVRGFLKLIAFPHPLNHPSRHFPCRRAALMQLNASSLMRMTSWMRW